MDGRQAVCPGEVVAYTCTVTQTTILDWTAEPFLSLSDRVRFGLGSHNEQATQNCSDIQNVQCTDIDFLATLTSVGPIQSSVADLTSTFTFAATAWLNGTMVRCSGFTAHGVVIGSDTLNITGGAELDIVFKLYWNELFHCIEMYNYVPTQ